MDDLLGNRPGFLIWRLHQIHLALFAEAQPGLEQVALAYEEGVDRATLANVLARLEGRGLIARAAANDRRVKRVSLTLEGRATLARTKRAAERAHARTIEALPPAERDAFLGALRRLVGAGNGYSRAPMRLAKPQSRSFSCPATDMMSQVF